MVEVAERYFEEFNKASSRIDGRKVSYVEWDGNVVLKIDLIGDEILKEVIRELGVSAIYVSESTERQVLGDEPQFILVADPLDGSRNYLREIPFYSMSIAAYDLRSNSIMEAKSGVVIDLISGELFKCDSRAHRGKRNPSIEAKPLISVYMYGVKLPVGLFKIHSAVSARTLGCLSLELCYVAEGRMDALIEARGLTRVVDVAGSIPILREAGCLMTDLKGDGLNVELSLDKRFSFIASRSREIHLKILDLLEGV